METNEVKPDHNNPPEVINPWDDDIAKFMELGKELRGLSEAAQKIELSSPDEAEEEKDLFDRIKKASRESDDIRKKHTAIPRATEKKINDAFKPLIAGFDAMKNPHNGRLTAFANKLEAERQRVAAEERKKAESEAAEAARLAALAEQTGDFGSAVIAEQKATAAKETERTANQIEAAGSKIGSAAGGTRSGSIRRVKVVTIDDHSKVYRFLNALPDVDMTRINEAILSVATQAVRASGSTIRSIPGAEISEKQSFT